MKSILIAITFALISIAASSQTQVPKLQLTPYGFTGPDSTKNFIVLEYPKISKSELYKKTLTYLNSIYKNPSNVISSVDGESISVNGFDDSVYLSGGLYNCTFKYSTSFQFRDGKIKATHRIYDIKKIFHEGKTLTYDISLNSKGAAPDAAVNSIYLVKNNGDFYIFNSELRKSLEDWINSYMAGIHSSFSDTW